MNPVHRKELPPLENPVVLGEIFKYCDKRDLAACRKVSKLWRDSSLKEWRQSVHLLICNTDGNSTSDFVKFVTSRNCNHSDKPFVTRYLIWGSQNIPTPFWTVSSHCLNELRLVSVKFGSLREFQNVIYNECPNLHRLELAYVKVAGSERSVKEPRELLEPRFNVNRNLQHLEVCHVGEKQGSWLSWMELLTHFPCVNSLTLNYDIPNWSGLLMSWGLIRAANPNNLQLKHIKAYTLRDYKKQDSILQELKAPGHHLVSLEMTVYNPDEASQFQEILKLHASSLKKLVLHGNLGDEALNPSKFFPLPTQSKLESLEEFRMDNQVFSSLAFLKFTPNIKKLVLFNHDSPIRYSCDFSEMRGVILAKCEELQFHPIGSQHFIIDTGREVLRELVRCFPNLKRFFTDYLERNEFTLLCEGWPNLVLLEFIGDKIDDCTFTGLDAEDVARINEEGENCVWRPITVPRANITNLKDLQTLIVSSNNGNLKHISRICGIQQLPRLRYLDVCARNPEQKLIWDSLNSQFALPEDSLANSDW